MSWQAAFPHSTPTAHVLRIVRRSRWVRFHTLPGSERIASGEQDRAEVLRRYHAVLDSVASPDTAVVVITGAWAPTEDTEIARTDEIAAMLPAAFWMTTEADGSDLAGELHASEGVVSDPSLDDLLLLVADDKTAEVIIAAPDFSWLVCPYDGGLDVIARNAAERDEVRERFADWLSPLESGL